MPTRNLTVRCLNSINPPPVRRIEYWDASTPGFGPRVTESGRKSWVVLYRHQGRPRHLTLGTYPTPCRRDQARDSLRAVTKGNDPASEKGVAPVSVTRSETSPGPM